MITPFALSFSLSDKSLEFELVAYSCPEQPMEPRQSMPGAVREKDPFAWLRQPDHSLFVDLAREAADALPLHRAQEDVMRVLRRGAHGVLQSWKVCDEFFRDDVVAVFSLRIGEAGLADEYVPTPKGPWPFLIPTLWFVLQECRRANGRRYAEVLECPIADLRVDEPFRAACWRFEIGRVCTDFQQLTAEEQDLIHPIAERRFDRDEADPKERQRQYVRRCRCLNRLRELGDSERWGR